MLKSKIFLLLLCFTILFVNAQKENSFETGRIDYEILIDGSQSIDTVKNSNNKKMLMRMKKILDSKTFTLEFNTNEAVFKSLKVMNIEDQEDPILKLANIISRKYKVYYRNNLDKLKLRQVEFSGKKILIEETFDEEDWTITEDKKFILGYECIRAFKKITEFNPIKKETRVFFPEVWFCPKLNYSFGAIGLDGLPGLVLEATINNKFIYRAKSINLDNPKISFPEMKGKRMTENEYKELLKSISH